jgi:hypothetical protein
MTVRGKQINRLGSQRTLYSTFGIIGRNTNFNFCPRVFISSISSLGINMVFETEIFSRDSFLFCHNLLILLFKRFLNPPVYFILTVDAVTFVFPFSTSIFTATYSVAAKVQFFPAIQSGNNFRCKGNLRTQIKASSKSLIR